MPAPSRRRRWVRRLAVVAVVLVAVWLGGSAAAVRRLTARPQAVFAEPAPAVPWGTVEPHTLATADGQTLGAWHVRGRADRPPVLLLHGNGKCRSRLLPEAELVAATGSPVLLVSFRCHGDSTGDHNDFGYTQRFDVLAATDWLATTYPGRPAVVWGQSLGAAAAVFAAPDVGDRAGGYVLECPYQDLRTATRNRTRIYLPAGAEAVIYAGFAAVAPVMLPAVDDISPVRAAKQVPPGAKVLVLAGAADRRATVADAEAVTAALGDRAELVVFPGDHVQLAAADPAAYRDTITRFVERCR